MDFWRQLGILPPSELKGQVVTVAGVGGIGSPTVMSLAKMGIPDISIYDDDVVDKHNLPNQLYRLSDIGKLKVLALQEIVQEYSDSRIKPFPSLYTSKTRAKGIVVSAVHSMQARKDIWAGIRYNIQIPVYIEARMGIEVLRLYTVRPTDPSTVSWYEKTLYSDEHAHQAPCTERAISYTVFMAAALISSQVKKFIMGQDYPREIIFDLKNLILMLE